MVIKTIFKAKYFFREPEKKELLIFDGESLEELQNVLTGLSYQILETRFNRLNKIFITPNIIFQTFKNFRKNIFNSYLLTLIDIIKPKVVFTFIDNSFRFSEFASLRHKNYKFVALQNGARYEQKIFQVLYKRKIIDKNEFRFYIPYFFCFGENEIQDYKKNKQLVKKFTKVGSLRVSNYLNLKKNKKKINKKLDNDILLISDVYCWDKIIEKTNFPIEQGVAKLLKFCVRFAIKNKSKIKIATRSFKNYFEKENSFYKKYLNDQEYNYLVKNLFYRQEKYATYKMMEKSKIVLGTMSTLLRENLFIDGKTLSCNFTGTDIFDFPIKGLCSLKNCNYDIFEKRVKKLLNVSNKNYLAGLEKDKSFLIFKNGKNSTIKLVNSKLKSLLK